MGVIVYRLIRFWIKSALVNLLLGMATGLYMKSAQYFAWPMPWGLIQAHTHLLMVGFMLMLIMGVATWFFPRVVGAPTETRGLWLTFWVMALSTWLRYGTEVVGAFTGHRALAGLALIGGLGQIAGTLLFVTGIWYRIRPVGSQT